MTFTPYTASTGKKAIEKSMDKIYNLAILDIRLPDMEGTKLPRDNAINLSKNDKNNANRIFAAFKCNRRLEGRS